MNPIGLEMSIIIGIFVACCMYLGWQFKEYLARRKDEETQGQHQAKKEGSTS